MATSTDKESISEDQATEALHQLIGTSDDNQDAPQPAEPEPMPEEATEAGGDEDQGPEEVEDDDLASLQARNKELESKFEETEKRYESRVKALQDRTAASERILRDRYIRKASAADKARKILMASRTEEGAAEADVDRIIQELDGTMNPASPSYAPPPEVGTSPLEEQALVLNSFLNEKGMTLEESTEFGNWIKTEGSSQMTEAEQAVAGQSLDGFLRIAHPRWREGAEKAKKAKTDDAVGAVKSVQKIQRDAARAASATPNAPRKSSATKRTAVDVSKLTPDDVSRLVRQSVEQYYH